MGKIMTQRGRPGALVALARLLARLRMHALIHFPREARKIVCQSSMDVWPY